MPKQLTWRQAIDKVLASSPTPLHYTEITEQISSQGLRTVIEAHVGKVSSEIARSIKRDGADSPYVRISIGTYILKSRESEYLATLVQEQPPEPIELEEEEEKEEEEEEQQHGIIPAFGMFWRKDAVEWSANPKLLGTRQIGSEPVNFSQQLGIYLLYNKREVVYVGYTTDCALGRKLYQHTIDFMSARWDRFSWFGTLPVSKKGHIGSLPTQYDTTQFMPVLEAVLIESLEPRQNKKRGEGLATAVEYTQIVDSEK